VLRWRYNQKEKTSRETRRRAMKRMKAIGNVKVPQEAFMAVLKLD